MLTEHPISVKHLKETYARGRMYLKSTPFHDSVDIAKKYVAYGPSVSLFLEDTLVACIGIVLSSTGVGAAWARVTDEVEKCPLQFTRYVHRFIENAAEEFHLRRIEVLVDKKFYKSINWLLFLGFEREGLLRKVNPDGSDSYIMALFPDIENYSE